MINVHLHLPAGAQKKMDRAQVSPWYARVLYPPNPGSSTRCSDQVCAMVSLLVGIFVSPTAATTGEVHVPGLTCVVF